MIGQAPQFRAISTEDISWAARILGLPLSAFSGSDGSDPRLRAIQELDSLDVEACPGSGKTTLLVAKLAILARHWTSVRRGICVLSHTNVARREIEHRLGSTAEGNRLLSYPHFIGTIHGFVNEFLALPWLRSKPLPVRLIDDDICLDRRWYKLPRHIRTGLEKNSFDKQILRIAATDFSVGSLRWGRGTLGRETETYRAIQRACQESCSEGYFCHNEMFLWAEELLERSPQIVGAIRQRFPLLFIDEVQDTNPEQSALLFRLFVDGENAVVRQRFGDSNQAIYHQSSKSESSTDDPFPDPTLKWAIPNSHRFGPRIAALADPLGVSPHGLIGLGPRQSGSATDTEGKHAVFLFDDGTVEQAIPSYAAYLIEIFSPHELKAGTFTAVGATHRPGEESNNVPRHVAHYWPAYDHELTSIEPRPRTLVQYVAAGRDRTQKSGDAHHVVERFAEGILRLAAIMNPLHHRQPRKRRHRQILEILATEREATENYREAVLELVASNGALDHGSWLETWGPKIRSIAAKLAGAETTTAEVMTFLSAHAAEEDDDSPSRQTQQDNVLRYPPQNPVVYIRVGSIHSVKGETHTATLVLDTFFRKHHLTTLKPWLLGTKAGGSSESDALASRLRQHYVAMTRPSHLLCLAMREDGLSGNDIPNLKGRGWRVARVGPSGPTWL
jgi:superfamily I DNA/RNA helicase